jgi:hypothetical protein
MAGADWRRSSLSHPEHGLALRRLALTPLTPLALGSYTPSYTHSLSHSTRHESQPRSNSLPRAHTLRLSLSLVCRARMGRAVHVQCASARTAASRVCHEFRDSVSPFAPSQLAVLQRPPLEAASAPRLTPPARRSLRGAQHTAHHACQPPPPVSTAQAAAPPIRIRPPSLRTDRPHLPLPTPTSPPH